MVQRQHETPTQENTTPLRFNRKEEGTTTTTTTNNTMNEDESWLNVVVDQLMFTMSG